MSDQAGMCIYCAGPLFNDSERTEMTRIADVLCDAGYRVYLPHRDGMEFRLVHEVLVTRGWDQAVAGQFLHAAIFALDVYQLVTACDAMVWNLNGRVPDEGAVSEAAMAWMLGKPLVAYQDDVRSLIAGRVNPLLVGMVDFDATADIEEIPGRLAECIERTPVAPRSVSSLPPAVQRTVRDGERLWECLLESHAEQHDEIIADCVVELFAPNEKPAVHFNRHLRLQRAPLT